MKHFTTKLSFLTFWHILLFRSRLGCQIVLSPQLEGLEVTVPEGTFDARGDSQ